MANEMGTVKVILDGFVGGPGLMQFRFQGGTPGTFSPTDATAAIAAVHTLIDSIKGSLYGTVVAHVQSAVEVHDWVTGVLISVVNGTGVTGINCTGGGTALTAEGPLLQWRTGTVVSGRMLRGRTYLVPSSSTALDTAGTVTSGTQGTNTGAGNTYAGTTAVTPSVWHRPTTTPTVTPGTVGAIISCTCPSKVAVLRSRRD